MWPVSLPCHVDGFGTRLERMTDIWCTKLSHRYFCTDANLAAEKKKKFFLSDLCSNGGACKHTCRDREQIYWLVSPPMPFPSKIGTIWKWENHMYRWMDAYYGSLSARDAQFKSARGNGLFFFFFFEAVWYQYMYIPSIYSIYYIIVPNWILWKFYLHQFWSY